MTRFGLLASVLLWSASALAQPFAFVPSIFDNKLRKIDLVDGSIDLTATIGSSYPAMYGVAIPPDATKVYVVSYLEQKLIRLETSNLAQASGNLPTNCMAVAVSPDHGSLFIGCSDGTVRRFSPTTLTQVASVTLPGTPFITTLSVVPASGAYRGRVYATDGNGTAYVLYLDNLAFKKSLSLGSGCGTESQILWNGPAGFALCKSSGVGGSIVAIDACNGDVVSNSGCYPKNFTDADFRAVTMTMNPGRTAFFVAGEDWDTAGVSIVKRVKMSDCSTSSSINISGAGVYGISNGDTNPNDDGGVRVAIAQADHVTGLRAIASTGNLALHWTASTSGAGNFAIGDFVPQPAPVLPCSNCTN